MNFKKRVNGSWANTPHYIHNTSTDTLITLPTVLYPNGTTATVGLKGQTLQSSVPSPTSPVMPNGVGERTGNLFDWNWLVNGYHLDPQTGLPTTHPMRVSILQPIDVSQLTTATISYESINVEILYAMYSVLTTENTLIRRVTNVASGSTLDLSGGDKLYIAFYNGVSSGATAITKDNITNIMLNTGSTPLPHENFGYKIPISSANTTTPVYLGEVESTRRIKKLVLAGTESWMLYKGNYYSSVTDSYSLQNTPCRCTHTAEGIIIENGSVRLKVFASWFTAVASNLKEWKTYLQQQYQNGTPVTVWYMLAEPETAVVNEPLMKIGNYADTLSNVSIPVTAGGDTLSVGTTVQPSEVTVNYKGWHPVSDVHERSGGQWT